MSFKETRTTCIDVTNTIYIKIFTIRLRFMCRNVSTSVEHRAVSLRQQNLCSVSYVALKRILNIAKYTKNRLLFASVLNSGMDNVQEANDLLNDIVTVLKSKTLERRSMASLLQCGIIELVKKIWDRCLLEQHYRLLPRHIATSLWVIRPVCFTHAVSLLVFFS